MKKTLRKVLPVLALVLVVAVASVGGTIAWLSQRTATLTNTFTVGDVSITLKESKNGTLDLDATTANQENNTYKFIPGTTLTKDPTVTVLANSEKCYVFVKVTEAYWPTAQKEDGTRKISYSIDSAWTPLDGVDGVYWMLVNPSTADQAFEVLTRNEVDVDSSWDKQNAKEIREAIAAGRTPTLTFKAYAIQADQMTDEEEAWGNVEDSN